MNKIILLSLILSSAVLSMETEDKYKETKAELIKQRDTLLLDIYNVIPNMNSGEIYEYLLELNPEKAERFLGIEKRLDDIHMILYGCPKERKAVTANDENN